MNDNKKLPTWNLQAMYENDEAWERDFERLRPLAEKFASFKGRLSESPDVMRQAFEASDEFGRLAEKVGTYANHKCDEDTTVNASQVRAKRFSQLMSDLSELSAWFDPEMVAIPEETIEKFLKNRKLAFYRFSIEDILRGRKHILSEPEERLLGALSNSLGASERIFDMLNDAELSFGSCRNTQGKLEKLTHGSYRKFLESPDRSVRKGAFTRLYRKYKSFRNTFATILDGNVRVEVAEARIRGFKSALDAALYGDDIPAEVYRNLISTVHGNLEAFYRYIDIRAKALEIDDIDMYDIMPPIVKGCDRTYSFDEARSIVAEALRPLGKEYGRILESAYADRWIDVPERKGKRSGAYSGGCFDSFPYVLLNFNGTLDDVFTLAHELGHSMHSHFSRSSQPYHYADYDIFVAEVASTTNEILLYEHLLSRSSSKAEWAFLHSHLADEIRGTIYRQTMFAEFELDIHNRCEQGLPLTADYLCDRYYELNSLYYGPNLKADKLIAMEWARIPHFYYNFYVYKYATGMSAALKLAQDILSGNTDAYFGFLKAGGSKYPLEIMKDAGVDLSSPEPVDSALKYFDTVVGKLGKALK